MGWAEGGGERKEVGVGRMGAGGGGRRVDMGGWHLINQVGLKNSKKCFSLFWFAPIV